MNTTCIWDRLVCFFLYKVGQDAEDERAVFEAVEAMTTRCAGWKTEADIAKTFIHSYCWNMQSSNQLEHHIPKKHWTQFRRYCLGPWLSSLATDVIKGVAWRVKSEIPKLVTYLMHLYLVVKESDAYSYRKPWCVLKSKIARIICYFTAGEEQQAWHWPGLLLQHMYK